MRNFSLSLVLLVSAFPAGVAEEARLRYGCCPFCNAPSLTLTEQFADADAVVLVEWQSGEQATDKSPGTSEYRIVEVARNKGVRVNKGDAVKLKRYRAAKKGDQFVLMGTQGEELEWASPLAVTKESYAYMSNAPSPDLPTVERLKYFVKFLEHKDEDVALDAYGEFANAPYDDILPLKDQLPRKELLKWVTDKNTSPARLGLYGLLLGLCGSEKDAAEMEKIIVTRPKDDFRLGIDGIVFGYLWIRGEKGLDVVEKAKLASATWKDKEGNEHEVRFSETFAVLSAIRQMWELGKGRIPKQRLRKSLRLLLKRPAVVDLVIPDLARWKDWEISEQLYELYGVKGYDIRPIKIAIIKFLFYATKDKPKDAKTPPAHVVKAQELLDKLKERDPKMVRSALRTVIR